jgi:hypothetical protein
MYRKSSIDSVRVLLLFCCFPFHSVFAQFTLTGQLRTRTEVRNGYANLPLKGSKSAAVTSQRTRLIFGYKWDRISVGVSIQDVRVWGQDASSISSSDGNKLMLHEGWAELILANEIDTTLKFRLIDFMSLKIGRQELAYDDVRLLGNLDWLQQGRRHDMVLLKTVHKGFHADIGFAYNQNTDAFGVSNTGYVPANVAPYVKNSLGLLVPTPPGILPLASSGSASVNSSKSGTPVWTNPPTTNGGNQDYKSFTSLYVSRKFGEAKFSFLFFNDNFGKYRIDSVGTPASGYVYGRRFVADGITDPFDYSGTHHRYTYGLMVNHSIGTGSPFGKISVQAAYYAQSGQNRDGGKMKDAFHYTLAATYQTGKISITPGYDVLSGNNLTTAADEKFDPLYGTPHRHWGYMDYFYVGTGSPAGGLNNLYLKVKYTGDRLSLGVDLHRFFLNTNMKKGDGSYVDKQLGNELDLLLNYNINKFTNLELGYSTIRTTGSMPFAKGQAATDITADTYKRSGNWFYGTLRFMPDFLQTKPPSTKQ